jgi:proton glutamate symport protein
MAYSVCEFQAVMMKVKIHTQILVAMILGVGAGVLLGERAGHLKFVGDIFIRLLKMIIIPLVMASMITSIAGIGNIRELGRIGLRTFVYYMTTTLLAVSVGLIMVNLIRPGVGVERETAIVVEQPAETSVVSIITNIFPDNIFGAMAQGEVLPIIFFSLLLGVAINSVGDRAKSVANLFGVLNEVMLRITHWIIRLAPVAVFALVAYTIGQMGVDALKKLALYVLTVVLGLGIHGCITLPILLVIFGRYSPLKFFGHMFSALATAFSTASSAAALPVTMECIEENVGVSNRVASFVLPIGATVNMDGTALYQTVAAVFIAQAYQVHLSLGQQLIIMLTAALASVGVAAIPSVGMIMLVIVLRTVGLPAEGITLIWGVDRFLDMCRTSVNVWGDSCGATIVARLEGEELTK